VASLGPGLPTPIFCFSLGGSGTLDATTSWRQRTTAAAGRQWEPCDVNGWRLAAAASMAPHQGFGQFPTLIRQEDPRAFRGLSVALLDQTSQGVGHGGGRDPHGPREPAEPCEVRSGDEELATVDLLTPSLPATSVVVFPSSSNVSARRRRCSTGLPPGSLHRRVMYPLCPG
jgi:hypothetical protein